MHVADEDQRAALLLRILREPRELADEQVELARINGMIGANAGLPELLAATDAAFHRHLDAIGGLERRGLSFQWWHDTMVPLLRELEAAHRWEGDS